MIYVKVNTEQISFKMVDQSNNTLGWMSVREL